jgi:hypothetical protein
MTPYWSSTATLFVASMLLARGANAQAFVPAAGEGNVTIAYQNLLATGHLDLNGHLMPGASGTDHVHTHALVAEAELGITGRLAVSVALPYIRSRYDGTAPHRPGGIDSTAAPREWDDGHYHQTFQDFRVGARYNIMSRPVAITPFVDGIIPSHHYANIAHAAVGKDLRAVVFGGTVGGFLDRLAAGLFFQSQVSHAIVQEVLNIRPNRSRVDSELGYFITPRLAVRFLESYQLTHDGIDIIAFDPMTEGVIHNNPGIQFTGEYRVNHDRLQRANYLTLGGGVSFALRDSVDIFTNVVNTVWGENVHPLRGITVGLNTHFRLYSSP